MLCYILIFYIWVYEFPAKYKEKGMTKVFRISLEGIKFAKCLTTWTRRAKGKLSKSVAKYTKLKATLTTQKDESIKDI